MMHNKLQLYTISCAYAYSKKICNSPVFMDVSSIRAWNNLDSLIREASSINSFKILIN